jgi:hypothetical protein
MINHARTLIANRTADYFDGLNGAVYIPENYRPVILNSTMQAIRNSIIPAGIDPQSELAVLSSVMRILHCPELATYTLTLDPRITYSVDGLSQFTYRPELTRTFVRGVGCDITPGYVVNSLQLPSDPSLAGWHRWTITAVSRSTAHIASSRGRSYDVNMLNTRNSTTTRSISVDLIPGYLKFYFDMPSSYLTGTYTLDIATLLPMPYDVADANAALTGLVIQPLYSTQIFKATPDTADIVAELRSNWLNAQEVTIKFGCAVLGYMYQCDALRVTNGV